MQRRATALWAALFIVLSVGAYAMIGVAEEPALVESPDHSIANGSSVELGGEEYDVGVEESGEGLAGNLTYFNESARSTDTLAAEDEVDYRNQTYTVVIPNESDPTSFRLRHVLPDDAETVTVNETEYVVVEQDGERTLVEPDQYLRDQFGSEAFYEFAEGDQFEYEEENATVDIVEVTEEEVRLAWDDPVHESIIVQEGDRITLGGMEYVAHVPSQERLVLTSDIQGYEDRTDLRSSFNERVNGLWGAVIIGVLGAVTLLGLAYMPSRY